MDRTNFIYVIELFDRWARATLCNPITNGLSYSVPLTTVKFTHPRGNYTIRSVFPSN